LDREVATVLLNAKMSDLNSTTVLENLLELDQLENLSDNILKANVIQRNLYPVTKSGSLVKRKVGRDELLKILTDYLKSDDDINKTMFYDCTSNESISGDSDQEENNIEGPKVQFEKLRPKFPKSQRSNMKKSTSLNFNSPRTSLNTAVNTTTDWSSQMSIFTNQLLNFQNTMMAQNQEFRNEMVSRMKNFEKTQNHFNQSYENDEIQELNNVSILERNKFVKKHVWARVAPTLGIGSDSLTSLKDLNDYEIVRCICEFGIKGKNSEFIQSYKDALNHAIAKTQKLVDAKVDRTPLK